MSVRHSRKTVSHEIPGKNRIATWRRTVTLGIVAVIGLAVVFPTPASARIQRGINGGSIWDAGAAQDRDLDQMRAAGATWIRPNLHWTAFEPAKGQYNPALVTGLSNLAAKARARGMKVILTNSTAPQWANNSPNAHTPPLNNRDYADFMSYIASLPAIRGQGVYYQIWNEPNLRQFWPGGVSPKAYTDMLKAVSPAIRSADPSATILLGGLSQSGAGSMHGFLFLEGVYQNGGRPYFDHLSNHVYPKLPPFRDPNAVTACPPPRRTALDTKKIRAHALCGIRDMRDVMAKYGDGNKDIFITEFGWSTYISIKPDGSRTLGKYGVTEAEQAAFLTRGLTRIDADYPNVPVALWYNLRDFPANDYSPTDILANFGLYTNTFRPKAAYESFRTWVPGAGGAATTPPGLAPLYRYYNRTLTSHFYSMKTATPSGYSLEGAAGLMYGAQAPKTAPLYNLYRGSTKSHYYTMSKRQHDLAARGLFKGYRPISTPIVGYMFKNRVSRSDPLYHLYSPRKKNHFYTMSKAELRAAKASGYRYKNVVGYLYK